MKKHIFLYTLSLCLLMPKISQSGGKISTARTPQPAPTQAAPTQAAPTQAAPTQAAPTQAASTQPALIQATGNGEESPIEQAISTGNLEQTQAAAAAETASSTTTVMPKGTLLCHFDDPKNIRPKFSQLNDTNLSIFDTSIKQLNIWFINASYENMKETIKDTSFNNQKIKNLPFEKKSFAQAKAEGLLEKFEQYEWLITKHSNYSRDGKNKFMFEPVLLVLVDFN